MLADESSIPYQRALDSRTVHSGPRSITRDLKATSTSDSSEATYWTEKFGFGTIHHRKKYSHPRSLRLQAGTASVVHQILLSPTAASTSDASQKNTLMAVACGPRVPLYGTTPQSSFHTILSSHTSKPNSSVDCDRQVPTSGQLALSVALRVDGRLLAIGTDTGVVRVADTTSRVTLCQMPCSTVSIRSVAWLRDGQHILAAGDDGVLRVWHLKDNTCVVECKGHGDGIRCTRLWQTAANVVEGVCTSMAATGSYDHTVRLWDLTELDRDESRGRCMSVLEHDGPVEAVEWIKSSQTGVPVWLVAAGGCNLKVWNPISGACVHSVKSFHRKTITSLLMMPRKDFVNDTVHLRIITGGLDGLLRVYSWDKATGRLKYLHGISLNKEEDPIAITALTGSFSGDRIAIGTASGEVLVRQMGPQLSSRKRTATPSAGTYAFFRRGTNADPSASDHVVAERKKKQRMTPFDVALRQFRYSDALDEALSTGHPSSVVSVLEELGKRHALLNAISNRDEETIQPLLEFVAKYIQKPDYSVILVHVANRLIDIYGDVAAASLKTRTSFKKLKDHVHKEFRTQKKLLRLSGQIDAIVTKMQR